VLRSNVNTSFVILISGRQRCAEIVDKVYSELIQQKCILRIVVREICGLCKDVERGVVFFCREQRNFSSGTIKRVQHVYGRILHRGTVMDRSPSMGVRAVYEHRG